MRLFGVAIAVSLSLVACDESPAQNAVGISRDDQSLRVHYVPCPGERVERVELIEASGAVIGDSDDVVLWAITSATGSADQIFEVGSTPEGFAEAIAFGGRLPETGTLAASVDTSAASGVVVSFNPDDLRDDKVLTGHGQSLSLPDFEEHALQDC